MFKEIKELEDLKAECSRIQAENTLKNKELKKRIIKEVASGYIELFTENGFSIKSGENSRYIDSDAYQITASYQSAHFVLNVPSEDSGNWGAINSRFEFMFDSNKWIIVATEKGHEDPEFRIVIQDDDKLIQLKKDIEEAKNTQLKLSKPVDYSLVYYLDGNKDNKKIGSNIKSIIEDILSKK